MAVSQYILMTHTHTQTKFDLITVTLPLTQGYNQVLACSVYLPAGDIHHSSQFEPLCDEEAQIW